MKPKNRHFCVDCGRLKMLFDTEKKAQLFIKYNGNDILREGQTINQIRIYYCPSCCGYHLTTQPYKKAYDYKTQNLIETYKRNEANKAAISHLKLSDNEIINYIITEAQKACLTSKNELKTFMTNYFLNNPCTYSHESFIRHQVYKSFKKEN